MKREGAGKKYLILILCALIHFLFLCQKVLPFHRQQLSSFSTLLLVSFRSILSRVRNSIFHLFISISSIIFFVIPKKHLEIRFFFKKVGKEVKNCFISCVRAIERWTSYCEERIIQKNAFPSK